MMKKIMTNSKTFGIIFLLLVVIFALLAGNGAISTAKIFEVLSGGGTESERIIIYQVRIPRIIAATAAGAALSVSGYLLQGALDNRIASPGILGINNGAGLFVLLAALFFPYQSAIKCLFAFMGAILVTALVSLLSVRTGMSKTSVILSGVAVSAACVSVIDMIISVKPESVADKVAFQLGGFATVQTSVVMYSVPMIMTGLIIAVAVAPGMDILALGDETAHGLGLNVKRYRWIYVLCSAFLAGASISMCGLIGFVGLIVPNCIRMIHSGKSRESLVLCAIYGAAFLLVCDTIARLLFYPYEMPCGLILSLIGAPFLIHILVKKRKRLGVE